MHHLTESELNQSPAPWRFVAPEVPRVLFESRGALLLHGPASAVQAVAAQLAGGALRLSAVTQGTTDLPWPCGLHPISGRIARLEGWLGAFRAFGATQTDPMDLAPISPNPEGDFDLVLDLANPPVLTAAVKPLGYFAPANAEALRRIVAELPQRTGKFSKPKYFTFEAARCAHRRQQVEGCRACLEACPAGAIQSDTSAVAINPNLCQGCGTCTLVCPTGAVAYQYPSLESVLARLEQALAEKPDAAHLCLCQPGQAETLLAHAEVLALEVYSPAAYGLPLWLSALCLGISRLTVLTGKLPPSVQDILDQQVAQAHALLGGLGWSADWLEITDSEPLDWLAELSPSPARRPAHVLATDTPRARVFAALDALSPADAPPQYALPQAAAYGEVSLDSARCTGCFACVRLCPERALQESENALWFTESRCVQCGLCVTGCPTQALSLTPRIVYDPLQRERARCLHRGTAFHCVACGQPFADRALVEHSLRLMVDSPAYQGEQRRLLEMCPQCRQRACLGTAFGGA